MSRMRPPIGISKKVIESLCKQVETKIGEENSGIYIVDDKHYLLFARNWLWVLSKRDDVEELLLDPEFPELPKVYSKYEYIKEFIETIKASEKIPIYFVKSDSFLTKTKRVREFRENLRSWGLDKIVDKEWPPYKQEETL